MKEGLIAFLGFLAASLVQVVPVTANFLQSDRLSANEAVRLTGSLTRQQHYWMGLLFACIASMVIVIGAVALDGPVQNFPVVLRHDLFFEVSWEAVVTYSEVASLSFVLIKTLGLFEGMMSLHRLRAELVVNTAKREEAEKAALVRQQVEIQLPKSIVPLDYGQVIQHQH
jgi:hypothetical protein